MILVDQGPNLEGARVLEEALSLIEPITATSKHPDACTHIS